MSERVIQTIVRAVFILALLGFGIAFALTSQPVFAGGCVRDTDQSWRACGD